MSETPAAPVRPSDVVKAARLILAPDGLTHHVICPNCSERVGDIVFGEGASLEDERNAIASIEKQCPFCATEVHGLDPVPATVDVTLTETPAEPAL